MTLADQGNNFKLQQIKEKCSKNTRPRVTTLRPKAQ
jgi:hypothetical protein